MTNPAIAELVAQLNTLDIQLWVEGEPDAPLDQLRLRCNAPAGTLTPELRQTLSDRKAELLAYLQQPAQPTQTTLPAKTFPLSFAQQRLWFLAQLAPHNPFYNVPAAIHLRGRLDLTALAQAITAIVQRHAALRTTFTTVEGQPVQVVAPDTRVELVTVALQTVAPGDRARISQQLATAEAQRPFNLTTDPLLRATLLQFDSTEAVLLLTLHHIVADGWSLGVLIRELASFYTAAVEGRSPELPPLAMQYTDFVCWQRQQLQGVLAAQLAYWWQQLQDLPVLDLPCDRPRPPTQTYRGATYPLQFSPALTEGLIALSQQAGTSLFMTLLAGFQALLYRYTGQTDIAIGSPIANRQRSEVEDLIGFFVNSLVMRTDLSGNPSFQELLQRVREVALAAYAHQDLPFEKLVEELEPDRDPSRNPLFQVAFALQNAPMQTLELPGLTLEPSPLESGSTRFDLEVHLWEPAHGLHSLWQFQAGLSGFIAYSTDLFDRDRIARLVAHFQVLLAKVVADPATRLSDLPLLSTAEQQQLLAWSQSPHKKPDTVPQLLQHLAKAKPEVCFHHIFEAHVQETPEAIALVTATETLTYAQLNQRADHLAQILQQHGVQPDELVGLCVERSTEMVVGILGILKAGAAYVPLDPKYPSDRLQFILEDTQVSIVLTQSGLAQSLSSAAAKLLDLDQLDVNCDIAVSSPQPPVTPDHLAYVIYTSGSTGTPKGVLLSHRGLVNVVVAQQAVFQLSRRSRVLQFSALNFDASIFEIALALGCGSTLYIPPAAAQLPSKELIQFLSDNVITHALLTPAVLAVLPAAELPDLEVLITGGETCSSQVIDRWATQCRFFNAYGPTETTIWATVAQLSSGDSPLVIGQPILNTQAYILDTHQNPVPIGIPGELYLGGVGLARGYLHRPELTAEKFATLLIQGKQSQPERLYRTGDRARFRSDGSIEFLGRVDYQIKIRGFRVELGEIESALQHHAAVQEAVVISTGASLNQRLVAYFSLALGYIDQARLQALQTQQLHHWQTLYNQTYQAADVDFQFNITGWNSSYTGEPIPLEQMQEWVGDRVAQILALQPQRILEIGCGTGLLLFPLAPHCQKYVGTDFSQVTLDVIAAQLSERKLAQVELLQRSATDFSGIEPATFDVVILNSVVQYFPSQDYLLQVLAQALQALAPGGVLFIGDVRSLPLLETFHAWVQFCQAEDNLERTQLQQQVARSHFEEPELAIDPAFFYALRDRFGQIGRVQIRLTRGRSPNEMTQFRYNVLLHVAPSDQTTLDIPEHNWELNPVSVAQVQAHLQQSNPEIYILTHVRNSRVMAATKITTWLQQQTPPRTVGRMRDRLQATGELAIDPEDWWDLASQLPYNIEIAWSTQSQTGNYDVLFVRRDIELQLEWPQPSRASKTYYTNNPLQSHFARQLIPELRQLLSQSLPDYMIPAVLLPLAALPLTPSGKVDRLRLAAQAHQVLPVSTQQPSLRPASLSPTEQTLTEIWQELLQLKQVNREDNFFELGGHSLLATQMTSRVRDALGLELPLKSVFTAPTIAQLAPELEALANRSLSAPPLVRLDRAAYRRQRSTLDSPSTQLQPASPSDEQPVTAPDPVLPSRSPLVPLTLGSHPQPFFCVHPLFGVVFPYLELAHYLESDRSFYGLQPVGLDGQSPALNRIEAIAASYIQAIQTIQPQGPYFLGGWSFGGLVAYEMAQQLTQAGEQIELLAIIDTLAPGNQPSVWQNLKFLLGSAVWSVLPFLLDYGALVTSRFSAGSWLSRWQWSAVTRLIPEEARLQVWDEAAIAPMLKTVYAHAQATYHYQPQPYAHRITLFQAAEPFTTANLGWQSFAKAIERHQIPGNHLSLLKQPHVQILAQQLSQYLS